MYEMQPSLRGLNVLQKISMSLMGVLTLVSFVVANLHAVLWQSSDWLVSTVLPAVVVDLTNQERAGLSETPLQRSAILDRAAELKAQHMAQNEYFSHFSPDGVSPWYWFDKIGYAYAYAGENLAIHFTDSEEVVKAWMESPAHRENIVNEHYTEIGVGTAKGKYEGYNTIYVVQLFGRPAVSKQIQDKNNTEKPMVASAVDKVSPPTTTTGTVQEIAIRSPIVPAITEESSRSRENNTTEIAKVGGEETDNGNVQYNNHEEYFVAKSQSEKEIIKEDVLLEDVVVIESPAIATSSGLAIANITTPNNNQFAGSRVPAMATMPNKLLQVVYAMLGTTVIVLLIISVIWEARRFRFTQVAYGLVLLVVMGGLWYAHSLLTAGAIIV
ncbi:MAG: hypothetical protein H6782_04835 [Candidatus Nomurabacteria bacterium]|nr:MAG: hypothetical protein H6782_04835 [Candidatus Nomurabacteria bacterium]